ncbi:MAG: putative lipid II flippase FtsW [Candidatus Zixiibacteriota bacterium]
MKAKSNIDWVLLYATAALTLFGLITVYSTSSLLAEERFGSHLFFFKRQLLWLLLAAIIIAVLVRIDLKALSAYSPMIVFGVIVALALVFLMPARNGSQRWLFVGPLTVQPSEFARLALVYYLAFSLSLANRDLSDYRRLLVPYLPIVGVILALTLLEPDLGTTLTLGLTVLALFFMAGARLYHLAAGLTPLAAGGALLVFVFGYNAERIRNYLETLADPLAGGYQVKQAILTLGAGGLAGVGLGDGRQKHFFLPYPHTDFVFAAIGEEVGFIGLTLVMALYLIIMYRGLRIASYQPDRFGYLLASGITLSLFFNVAINVGVVTSILPTTGLPLPLLSYGGSSLLVTLASIGMLLNLSRRRDGWTA